MNSSAVSACLPFLLFPLYPFSLPLPSSLPPSLPPSPLLSFIYSPTQLLFFSYASLSHSFNLLQAYSHLNHRPASALAPSTGPALPTSQVQHSDGGGACKPIAPRAPPILETTSLACWHLNQSTVPSTAPFVPSRSFQVRHPDGGDAYEPCAPGAPGAQECSLQYFADKGLADRVLPPQISRLDFDKVRMLACVLCGKRGGRLLTWPCGVWGVLDMFYGLLD